MATNTRLIYDGYVELSGVDGSRRPSALPRQLVHRAFNTVFRGDEAKPRPGVSFQPVTFEDVYTQASYHEGRFQCAATYKSDRGDTSFIVAKGGRIFRIDARTWVVQDISITERTQVTAAFAAPTIGSTVPVLLASTVNLVAGMRVRVDLGNYEVYQVLGPTQAVLRNLDDPPGTVHAIGSYLIYYDLNPGRLWQSWMCQAEKWMVIQDGESRAIIYDGASCRRAQGNEVPIGRSMAYGNGRLWLEMPDQRSFTGGDLIFGSSGTAAENYRDAVLKWSENVYLAGGGAFRVPLQGGEIRGMRFISNLDTSLGQGALQVFTTTGSFSVNAPLDRVAWNNYSADTSPIQTVSLTGGGCQSERSLVSLNSDILFRSRAGFRSFQIGRQNFSKWTNTPISKQVNWAIKADQPALLKFGSAIEHDQRYIATCAPQLSDRGVIHLGMVALDFEQVTWLDDNAPQWDGLWTAFMIYQLVKGEFDDSERAYAFTENGDGDMELFEITRDQHHDQADATVPTKIRWGIELASLSFPDENTPGVFDIKSLEGGEMHVKDLEDEVTFKVRFRPDGYACWIPWAWWTRCATMGACVITDWTECPDWQMGKPQVYGPMGFGRPPDTCDESNGRMLRNLYSVQLRLDVRGYTVLSAIRLAAMPMLQAPVTPPPDCSLNVYL